MSVLLAPQLLALQEAAGESSHTSAWFVGGFALVVLLVLLAITVIMGKGRPHS